MKYHALCKHRFTCYVLLVNFLCFIEFFYCVKMSSWKKAAKAGQKTHRERHQPENRAHLGLLEKKKDYQLRARDYNRKKRTLELLKKRALNKNPDEFYFHMVNSKTEDGVHEELEKEDEHTPEQLLLMNTQDLRYITMKRTMEIKKIEKLKGELHALDKANKTKNQHIFFVDNEKEAKNFDVAKHLQTHPSLLNRRINRIRLDDLGSMNLDFDNETVKSLKKQKEKMYEELDKRVGREKELGIIQQKLEVKKNLIASKNQKHTKVKKGKKNAAPVYKWEFQRKK